jgi:protein O-mannosyl-transferase
MSKKVKPVKQPVVTATAIQVPDISKSLGQVPTSPFNNKYTNIIAMLIVFLVSVGMYWNTKDNGFVLDDHGIIKSNKITKNGLSWDNIKTIFTTSHRKGDVSDLEHSLYRPVCKLIFAAEYQWGKDDKGNANPGYMHKWNTFYFMLCCMLLYWLLWLTTKKNWLFALLCSILFAVHPIHVECVANIKSLDEIIGTAGVLGTLICFYYFAQNNNYLLLLVALLSYTIGIFSKESAIVAVAIAPLYLYYFTNASLKQIIFATAVMFIGAALFLLMREKAIGWFLHSPAGQKEPSALDNVLALTKVDQTKQGGYQMSKFLPTVIYLMGYYVYTLFVPYPLSCDYSYASVEVREFGDWQALVSTLFFIGIIAYTILTFKKKNIIGFGIAWFLIASSIICNLFIVIGTSFGERLMFLPSVGWTIAVVALAFKLIQFFRKQTFDITDGASLNLMGGIKKYGLLVAGITIVSAVYGAKTLERNTDWKSDFKLFSTDVKKGAKDGDGTTNSTHLLFYWGNHLSSSEYQERIKSDGATPEQVKEANFESIRIFKKSMGIYPALPSDGYNQYGKAFYNIGNYDSAAYYYKKAHLEDTTNPVFINNLGTIFFQRATPLNRADYFDSARKYFHKAYDRDSTIIDYMNNLGAIYGTLANTRPLDFKLDNAIYWFYKGYQLDSISEGAILSCNSIAVTYKSLGDSNNMRAWQYKAAQIAAERKRKYQSGEL